MIRSHIILQARYVSPEIFWQRMLFYHLLTKVIISLSMIAEDTLFPCGRGTIAGKPRGYLDILMMGRDLWFLRNERLMRIFISSGNNVQSEKLFAGELLLIFYLNNQIAIDKFLIMI